MSLQAIAGVAYDRRHPEAPTRVAATRIAEEILQQQHDPGRPGGVDNQEGTAKAKQLNGALETLKRYIPTEFLALYLPFLAIAKERAENGAADHSLGIYLGFVLATPVAVALLYMAKAAEAGRPRPWGPPPRFEMLLATLAFVIWGASVPGLVAGSQWWLAMVAMASAFVLPLLDTVFGKKA